MLAARSARFYHSLCAKFDIAFADFSDRDAGFYATIRANPKAWFTPADFRRHVLYAAEFVRLAHVRLADPSRSHLRDYTRAGVVAFLFGRGADGATCACDAARDGVTNPAPVNGNTRRARSADDDGGFFRERARAYYVRGPVAIPR